MVSHSLSNLSPCSPVALSLTGGAEGGGRSGGVGDFIDREQRGRMSSGVKEKRERGGRWGLSEVDMSLDLGRSE